MSRIRESRRSEILLAARQEFIEKGLEAASMAEIARRAGVGKSTIYEYFPSKDKLLEEACTQLWEVLQEALEEAFSKEVTFRGKVLCYYRTVSAVMQEIGGNIMLLATQQPIQSVLCECVEHCQKMLLELIGGALRMAQENGEVDPDLDAELTTIMLTTQINPILLQSMEHMGKGNALEQVVDLIFRGIEKRA